MEGLSVGPAISFLAGLLSFASPCVLPLVPAYLGLLSGQASGWGRVRSAEALAHGAAFVGGFSLVFVLWGASATAIGKAVGRQLPWLQRAGGLFLILLGLHLAGALRLPFLYRLQLPVPAAARRSGGYLSAFLAGAFVFCGWVPCVGPVLTAILFLASKAQTVAQGAFLLATYCLGLGLPFLVLAAFAGPLLQRLKRLGRAARALEVVSGLLVAGIGLAALADWFVVLARYSAWFGL